MKCKNIECENETRNKNVYCSLTCRNIYVNKYLRNYDKVSDYYKDQRKNKEKEYYEQPKKCKKCDKVIEYDNRRNNFCNKSCSASFNNNGRTQSKKTKDKISNSVSKYIGENGLFGCLGNKYECNKGKKRKIIEGKLCKNCNNMFYNINHFYCNQECRKEYRRKNLTEFQKYKLDCAFKFGIKDYPNEFNFDLIKEHGWYKPKNRGDNLTGVSRDHIYSIKKGFENNIDPKIISHPANCQLLSHPDNFSKFIRCDITIEELKQKIKEFDKKYKKENENKQ